MKKSLLIYYAVLLLMLCVWTSPSLPPLGIRLVYFAAVLLPIFKRKSANYPAILSLFVLVSANRFAPSFMPFMPNYLLVATLFMLMGVRFKASVKAPLPLFVMLAIILCIDFIHSRTIASSSYILGIIILFFLFIDEHLEQRRNELALSFLIIVAILGVESLLYGNDASATETLTVDGMERVGWSDPNYFSHMLGMGALVALQLLFTYTNLSKNLRYTLLGLLFVIVLVMFLVASRGGLVALAGSTVVLALLSRKTNSNAIKLLMVMLLFVFALYAMGAFDIMFARVENEDEAELGGRSLVWASKLVEFTAQASPIDWIFGIGKERALGLANYLAEGEVMGFHNDYLAILLSYGIVGLLGFVFLLAYPIFKFKNAAVTSGIVFLALYSMSLEPMFAGVMGYSCFYFYLYIWGASTQYEDSSAVQESETTEEEQICTT